MAGTKKSSNTGLFPDSRTSRSCRSDLFRVLCQRSRRRRRKRDLHHPARPRDFYTVLNGKHHHKETWQPKSQEPLTFC